MAEVHEHDAVPHETENLIGTRIQSGNLNFLIGSGASKPAINTLGNIEKTINELDHYAKKEARDFSSALRYALKIGLLALVNPELTVQEIKDIIEAQVDYETGRISELKSEDL